MSWRGLADSVSYLAGERVPIHSLTVIRHGYIVLDAAFFPYDRDTPHDLASVSKSVTSTLVGIAIEQGLIKSVRERVLEIFKDRDVKNVDADKRSMTIEDVLTMRSGLVCVGENLGGKLYEMTSSPEWAQHAFDREGVAEPGTTFCYSNADSMLLAGIVRAASGKTASAFAAEHLFGPLGINRFIWPSDSQGNPMGWSEIRIAPHEMAKIGFLMLHRGRWGDRRIVSEEWVKAATTGHAQLPAGDVFDGYGYQWWTSPLGFFSANGRGGQYIAVFPALDLVIVTTGTLGTEAEHRKIGDALRTMLLPSIKSDGALLLDPDGEAKLKAEVARAAAAPDFGAPKPVKLPETARRISGKVFAFSKNPIDLVSWSLSFAEGRGEATMRVVRAGNEPFELPVGLDGHPRFGKGRYGLKAMASGSWESENVFSLLLDEIGNNARWEIRAAFEGDRVKMSVSGAGLGEAVLEGAARE